MLVQLFLSIFTLPGVVAAAGPAVSLSFLLAAIVAGLVAFTYAEMASTMPAGSTYSWINVLLVDYSDGLPVGRF